MSVPHVPTLKRLTESDVRCRLVWSCVGMGLHGLGMKISSVVGSQVCNLVCSMNYSVGKVATDCIRA